MKGVRPESRFSFFECGCLVRGFLCSVVLSLPLCQRLVDSIYVDLFLGSLF